MVTNISIIPGTRHSSEITDLLSNKANDPVAAFHRSLPLYQKTPLVALEGLAEKLGVRNIFVKDESHRFGLNAFKGLGASYAVAKILSKSLGAGDSCLSYSGLVSNKSNFKDFVFVTATDGNHGKGVAWAATIFGCRAIVYMPKGSVEYRAQAIRDINNTHVEITDLNYDDAVRFAAAYAKTHGYFLVQDTSFAGYDEIPTYIAQGYATMAREAVEQLSTFLVDKPTHVFLQAGVGSMAGSVLGYLTHYYNWNPPITTIVEPSTVACIYESARQNNGNPVAIGGNPETIMAGLNCGEPNPSTWPILRDYASFYASCPDWVTECGMRALAHPVGSDEKVISGESGAVGLGLLVAICQDGSLAEYKKKLRLDENSTILVFSTEGNTDPQGYEAIING